MGSNRRVSQSGNAFGDNALPAGNSRQGYTGHTLDNSAGLTYMKARYYDHNIGRFLSNDPVGYTLHNQTQSFNRYAYANNNPYLYTDPDGQFIETAWDIANVTMGVASFVNNIGNGNFMSAGVDAFGVVVDGVATVVPFVPGGVDASIKIKRGLDKATDAAQLSKSTLKGIKSLEKQILKHQKKLEDFKANPTVRPGMENLPKEVIQKQQKTSIKHLETEIETFRNNIDKIKNGDG